MKEIRRLRITTTHRRILRFRPAAVRAVCPVCAREVETLNAAQAAEVLEVEAPALSRLIAGGCLHLIETVSGSIRVCKDSLFTGRR